MTEVIKIFNDIQATSSKNEKEKIIRHNASNALFKKCLVFLLDTNITTGICDSKFRKPTKVKSTEKLNTFSEVIDYLAAHNTGTDVDIANVKSFVYDHFIPDDDEFMFYVKMITKKLKLGCDVKTANKAIPGLIPTWDVQLGSGFDKLKLKPSELIFVSRKMNGNRGSFYNEKIISRQGKVFFGLDHIISDIHRLGLDNQFLDGELIRKNIEGLPDNENFTIGTGILNSGQSSKEEIKFVIFDMFPSDELSNKKSKEKYKQRYENMQRLSKQIEDSGLKNIEVVSFVYVGTDHSVLPSLLDLAVENGWEGNMIAKNACYECKRTTNLIKQKRFYAFDLPIVEILEGDGKLAGTMGSVVVKFKNNTVNVGSGFDDEARAWFWENKESLIGRVIEVKYKEISKDKKTGLESLQFPIYQSLREIGKAESYE